MVRGYAFLTTLVLAASITAQTPGQLYDPLDGMDANGRIPKRRILTLVCALIPQPRKKTINYYGIFAPAAGRHGRVVPQSVPDDHPRGERAHPAADAPVAQPCRNLSLSTRRAASRRISNGQDDGTEWGAACISYPLARTIAAWKQAIGKGSIEKALEDLDVDTAEPLANVLCLLVAPSPADMLKEHRRATEALRECVEKLERRAR